MRLAKQSYRNILVFCILLSLYSTIFADQVAKFTWKGSLDGLNKTLIVPPNGTVAMSEFIYTSTITKTLTEKDPCSIMFIIDNSASNTSDRTDYTGERFKATIDLIDDIYRKAPETKVGVVLFGSRLWFYKPDNPDLFQSVPEDQFQGGDGCVIPPLELDKIYSGDAKGFKTGGGKYSKKGIEVLKMYLGTYDDTGMNGGTKTNYTPTHRVNYPQVSHGSQLTNITIAFDGARHGHKEQTPRLNNNRHFNIFFSDGLAGIGAVNPDYGRVKDYIKGVDAAPTFTVFYESKAQDLAALEEMTENIKNNGYSPQNSKKITTILNLKSWSEIKTKTKDLFNKILSSTSGTPTKITINSSKTSTNTNDSGFIYTEIFPLHIGKTPFTMDMLVHLKKDSLDELGNILSSTEKDSLYQMSYEVEPGPIGPQVDSMDLIWWGRTLSFGTKGAPITALSSADSKIDLLFEVFRVDTLYNYENVSVDIRTADNLDRETVQLNNNGLDWSSSINREVGLPNSGDGIVQHKKVDTLYATFRNPKLPLDTMEIKIVYNDNEEWQLGGGAYFDNSGDGKIDSLYVTIDGFHWEDYVDSIAKSITLPASRDFDKVKWNICNKGIGLTLKQNSPTVNTAISNSDEISVLKDTDFPNSSKLLKSSVIPKDSVSPVLLTANLQDSIREESIDKMRLTFSEEIKELSAGESFMFFDSPSFKPYRVKLISIENLGSSISATIEKTEDYKKVSELDSININPLGSPSIIDLLGNVQDDKNIHREISVDSIFDGVRLIKSEFYDHDGDGKVDEVAVQLVGNDDGLKGNESEIINLIQLPKSRNLSINSYIERNGVYYLDVTQKSNDRITSIKNNDSLFILKDKELSDGTLIYKSAVLPEDKMAPVIYEAVFVDSVIRVFKGGNSYISKLGNDSLELIYSEDITVDSFKNIPLFKGKDDFFRINTGKVKTAEFSRTQWLFPWEKRVPVQGDSVRIDVELGAEVSDSFGNIQMATRNRLVEVDVRKIEVDSAIAAEFTYTFVSTILGRETVTIPDNLKNNPKVIDMLNGGTENGGEYELMVLAAVPTQRDSVTYLDSCASKNLTIIDPVGNVIATDLEMVYNHETASLLYFWNGKNENGRLVGSGSYLAIMKIQPFFKDREKRSIILKGIIGVEN